MEGNFTQGPLPAIARRSRSVSQRFQHYLDQLNPHYKGRWLALLLLAAIYVVRVCYLQRFYVVTFCLAVYTLYLFIDFLRPVAYPKLEGPALPTKAFDELKPFIRCLSEFKFWYSITRAFIIAFAMTFFSILDLRRMKIYIYVPFSVGKQRYRGKKLKVEKASLDMNYYELQESEEYAILQSV
ncbi:hypothetical protein SUGI_0548440 [Cryptomeria japonica]|nr:hypothetical protein SUGI_0548440 [Cryptomeria japonica]